MKKLLSISVPEKDKTEFVININKINIVRSYFTAAAFIVLEAILLTIYYIANRGSFFKTPYGFMYLTMLSAMTAFLLIFIKLGNNVPDHGVGIRYAGIFFISFILAWCAGVSLLDQLTNGQVIVYVVAIISIAVTPIYEPFLLLLMYLIIHIFFLILMPYFQKSAELLFANSVNSTAFLIMSWAISCMRYKKHAEDFNNKKIIQEKNDELKWMNKELEEANRKLEILSQTDALTGVFNRFMFETKMKEEWCRCKRHSIPLSLIMADIDHFKSFNDKYGHQAGDHCIQQIAGILSASARRSSDIVARYGGEEFAIVLPHIEKEKALELAEQMRKRAEGMAVQHLHSDISDNITISLGVYTVIPTDELSIEGFIYNTDKALYKAKESRNCICSA
jgi:diguanylate cyclase (GGDEF)-like protein